MKNMSIAHDRIKYYRDLISMTQQQVVDGTGISLSNYKAIETGRSTTTVENMTKIANSIGVEVEKLYRRNTTVISVGIHKGGAGKTSTTSVLAAILSIEMGYKVLLIDADMQMNLTASFGFERDKECNLHKVIVYKEDIHKHIKKTKYQNLDMVISDFALSEAEMFFVREYEREKIFQNKLLPLVEEGIYDFVIIDTNPSLGMMNTNVFVASDYVIVPLTPDPFCASGLDSFVKFISDMQRMNKKLKLAGIVFVNADMRQNITSAVMQLVLEAFGSTHIFKTILPSDTNLKKSQLQDQPITESYSDSRLTVAGRDFAQEVLSIVQK